MARGGLGPAESCRGARRHYNGHFCPRTMASTSESPSVATSLNRTLLNTLVPGLIAIAPWLLLLLQHTSATLGLKEYPTVANAFLFAAVAVAGSLCNGFGTAIESNVFDPAQKKNYPVDEDWFDYLAFNGKEPVAFRYLARLYTTLSFELSMVVATPLFALSGGLLLYLRFPVIGIPAGILIGLAASVVSGLLFYTEARRTHEVLCQTRNEVLRRLRAAQAREGPPVVY